MPKKLSKPRVRTYTKILKPSMLNVNIIVCSWHIFVCFWLFVLGSFVNPAAGRLSHIPDKGQKFWHLNKLGHVLGWSKRDDRNFESGYFISQGALFHISPLICEKIDKRNHHSSSCTQVRKSKLCMKTSFWMENLVIKLFVNILKMSITFYDVIFPYLVKQAENGVKI